MTVVINKKGCSPSTIAFYLVIAGAINWGLVGLGHFFGGNWNLVNLIFGSMPTIEAVVYILVGVAGIVTCTGCPCPTCKSCREVEEAPKM